MVLVDPFNVCGVSKVGLAYTLGQGVFPRRHSDQMDVVGHKTIGDDTKTMILGFFLQET